jgi:transcriptional regulator with XRE-family HTH domain
MDTLRRARCKRALTQAEAGELLGVGPTQVSRYESGQQQPSPEVAVRLLALYPELQAADLLFVAGVPAIPSAVRRRLVAASRRRGG